MKVPLNSSTCLQALGKLYPFFTRTSFRKFKAFQRKLSPPKSNFQALRTKSCCLKAMLRGQRVTCGLHVSMGIELNMVVDITMIVANRNLSLPFYVFR